VQADDQLQPVWQFAVSIFQCTASEDRGDELMHPQDLTFVHFPFAALIWWLQSPDMGSPLNSTRLYTNLTFQREFYAEPLPDLHLLPNGTHLLRLNTRTSTQRVCRVQMCALPDGRRLGVIEDLHAYHLDALTQLDDRRALLLDAERPLDIRSLVLLDIDGFKAVNDALGHAAGDAALCLLARLLESAACRWGARAYRLGGDEFVLLSRLPLCAQQLVPVQAHFKQALSTLGHVGEGSFSYGLAQAPLDGQTLTALLRQADARLSTRKACRHGEGAGPLGQLLSPLLDAAGPERGGRR